MFQTHSGMTTYYLLFPSLTGCLQFLVSCWYSLICFLINSQQKLRCCLSFPSLECWMVRIIAGLPLLILAMPFVFLLFSRFLVLFTCVRDLIIFTIFWSFSSLVRKWHILQESSRQWLVKVLSWWRKIISAKKLPIKDLKFVVNCSLLSMIRFPWSIVKWVKRLDPLISLHSPHDINHVVRGHVR